MPKLLVKPIPPSFAKELIEKNHYSHRYPGATQLNFGVFQDGKLKGAVTFGLGVCKYYVNFVQGTTKKNYMELTRLWLADSLGKNSESQVIAICMRIIRKHAPNIKWILSYADQNQTHAGTIYQATNFLYTGVGGTTPSLKMSSGEVLHTRSLGKRFGTNSLKFWRKVDPGITQTEEKGKHRYIFFIDPSWRDRLTLKVLPYPKHAPVV